MFKTKLFVVAGDMCMIYKSHSQTYLLTLVKINDLFKTVPAIMIRSQTQSSITVKVYSFPSNESEKIIITSE